MSAKSYAVDWSHTEEKLSVWDGKSITHKLPKAEADLVIVTENIPLKMAKPFIEAGATVMRCNPNSSAAYRQKYHFPKTDDNDAIIIWDLYHDHPEKFRPMKEPSRLRQFYKNYQQLTDQIVAVKNRQWSSASDINKTYLDQLETAKDYLIKQLEKELDSMPIYKTFLKKIKGIGPAMAAGLIAEIGDISRFENVSDLYAYFGVHVKDGACVWRKKGEAANWNSTGRMFICELVPTQFIRQKTPVYRAIYEDEKDRCTKMFEADQKKHKSDRRIKNRMHAERRARRKTGKIFLHHLWKAWRTLEGLPVPLPWPLAEGGHSKEILPPTAYPGMN
jgi:hypothetical protein